MESKRRARSPPPRPSPPKQSADTTEGGEEVPRRAAAAKKQLKIARPRPSAAAADGADSSAVHSLEPVSHSTAKPAAPASQVESDGGQIQERAPKKAKPAKKSKIVPVLEAAPAVSGKLKRAKTLKAPAAAPSKVDAEKKDEADVQPEKVTAAATRPGKPEQLEKPVVVKEIAIQNAGSDKGTEEKTDEEDAEGGASVEATPRSFEELQKLYPNLAVYVQAEHPSPETVNTAFGLIGDEQAEVLESMIKALRTLEAQAQILDEGIRKNIINMAK